MLPGKSQIRMNSPLCLALLSLLAAPLVAQSNATSSLMTYGDVLGQPFSAQMSGLTPNATTILIPSFLSTGSSYLVGQSGDANDMLAVGIDLAANGNYFTGTANALGTATFN